MREETYRKYGKALQLLVCYVFRLAWQKFEPRLHYRLTDEQAVAMVDAVRTASELAESTCDGLGPDQTEDLQRWLDNKCLIFLVSLLDHKLYGNIYDIVVGGFLAVLGIRPHSLSGGDQKLYNAADFTPKLSTLIRMGQLLVVGRALLAVWLDEADVAAQALEAMQDRFMTKDSRSPISWSLKLRAYGKDIKDSTTSLGHIIWSDGNEVLNYKKMKFYMTQLRDLVVTEAKIAQNQLAELLLVPPDTAREDGIPTMSVRSIVDDPTESRAGWNFTHQPQNQPLHGHQRWIFDRILEEDYLRKDFFESERTATWRLSVVVPYLSAVNAFLERLLLVHLTGGQPA